jgi:hypothetical protein
VAAINAANRAAAIREAHRVLDVLQNNQAQRRINAPQNSVNSLTDPVEKVIANPNLRWNWEILTARPDISPEFMMDHPFSMWSAKVLTARAPLMTIVLNPDFRWAGGIWNATTLSLRPDLMHRLQEVVSSGAPLDWAALSNRGDISMDFILETHAQFPWEWHIVHRRYDYTPLMAYVHSDAPSDWEHLTRLSMYEYIDGHSACPWDHDAKVERWQFMTDLSPDLLQHYVTHDLDKSGFMENFDWGLFTHIRCTLPLMKDYPDFEWDMRIFVGSERLTAQDIATWGPVLLRKYPGMFVDLLDSMQQYVNVVEAGDEDGDVDVAHLESVIELETMLNDIWTSRNIVARDAFHPESDDENDPGDVQVLGAEARQLTRRGSLSRLSRSRQNMRVSYGAGAAAPYTEDDDLLPALEDIPLADAAGDAWGQDQDNNPFTGEVQYGLIGSLSDYPTPDWYSDNMSDDDADDPAGFARRRLHRLRHTRDDGVRGQFTMCPTGANDPMGYCGYRLQYKWGHRQRGTHKRY